MYCTEGLCLGTRLVCHSDPVFIEENIVPCVYSKITYVPNCYHRNWRAV